MGALPLESLEECQVPHKTACHVWFRDIFIRGKPYMLALAGRSSLHGNYACMVYWTKGAPTGKMQADKW